MQRLLKGKTHAASTGVKAHVRPRQGPAQAAGSQATPFGQEAAAGLMPLTGKPSAEGVSLPASVNGTGIHEARHPTAPPRSGEV